MRKGNRRGNPVDGYGPKGHKRNRYDGWGLSGMQKHITFPLLDKIQNLEDAIFGPRSKRAQGGYSPKKNKYAPSKK